MIGFKLSLLFLLYTVKNVLCEGELVILHAPEIFKFNTTETLYQSKVPSVFAASLGYPIEEDDVWSGLEIPKPFSYCHKVFVFDVPRVKSLESSYGQTLPLIVDEDVGNTFDVIKVKTSERYPKEEGLSLRVTLNTDDIQVSGENSLETDIQSINNFPLPLSYNHLSPLVDKDKEYLDELSQLNAIITQILDKSKKDKIPRMYWVRLPHLGDVSELHEPYSDSTVEAKKLLTKSFVELTDKIKNTYGDKVLVAAIAHDEKSSLRQKRETAPSATAAIVTEASLNLADDYDENFPVIFNIILWFSVALLFAVIAICMVIGSMDPGRDSIIYRMTSTRMKKEN